VLRTATTLAALSVLPTTILSTGCAPIDIYAFRAIQYNLEAEVTQNQVILLNIVRSSLHRPMEFTEITNIVGANTGSANATFNFPVGFRLPTDVTTGSAGGSLGGSTTFTIPVLDTQDFYQGLLNDIQPSLVAYYLQTPFINKELLLNLFVEKIVVNVIGDGCAPQNHSTTCERDFRNNPAIAEDIALFQTLVAYLLNLQPSAEAVKTKEKAPTATTTTTHAGAATINVNASASASTDTSGAGAKPQYRLCFSPRALSQLVEPSSICGALKAVSASQELAATTKVGGIFFSPDLARTMIDEIQQWFPDDRLKYIESISHFSGRRVDITFQFRSTGSIFNFLGQIVSAEEPGAPFPLYARARFNTGPSEWPPCWLEQNQPCKPIIVVYGGDGPALVGVNYAGSIYSVPGNPRTSYSPDVFTILKQLIALNLSGKNLPTTAILSVTP
jgi:hypothetical protein